MKLIDLTNQIFGRLKVIARDSSNATGQTFWICRCDCGNHKSIASYSLKRGKSKSCGCLQKELASKKFTIHGHNRVGRKSPEYDIWGSMIQRCTNPNNKHYPHYGGRGITVCDRWRDSFESFIADVGNRPSPKHSIDRIENDKGYEPGNVRWATKKQQCRNQRSNRVLCIDGVSKCVTEWAESSGIPATAIYQRLNRGWNYSDAVFSPSALVEEVMAKEAKPC